MKLKFDKTNRKLGKKLHTCRVCGETGEFECFLVREMMQGTKEEFVYFVCDHCGCLQIAEVPENLGNYYGSGYYSYQMSSDPDMKFNAPVTEMTKLLDVGCGAGLWLVEKAQEGWGNLYGCDPFLENDRHYGSRVTIRSCSIHEMEGEGTFDVIRMADSFEHVSDPLEVMQSARRLLKDGGILFMRIPTYPNIAFDRFGSHWYQLDAPRHLFLHSKESLRYLAEKSNLVLSDLRYESNNSQFIRSYFYQRGVPFYEQQAEYFSNDEFIRLQQQSEESNEKEHGDHMQVYFRKSSILAEGKIKKVVFLRFPKQKNGYSIPYPPVCKQSDADYLCFTDDEKLVSSDWNVCYVENLKNTDLEPFLSQYTIRWEIKPNQIQISSLSDSLIQESIVTLPKFGEFFHQEPDREDSGLITEEGIQYLFQMAKKCKVQNFAADAQKSDLWIQLFAWVIALAKERGDEYRGKVSVIELLSGLYNMKSRNLFLWSENLESLFLLTVPERAFLNWCKMDLSFQLRRPTEKVLEYYESYAKLLVQYQMNSDCTRDSNFNGLVTVEQVSYIMEAMTIAFCCYVKMGDEKKALSLLPEISLESAMNQHSQLFEEGFSAGDEVYLALFAKLTSLEWEEWSDAILDAFLNVLFEDEVYRNLLERLPNILSKMSVPTIFSWLQRSKEKRIGIAGGRLLEYAMKCEVQNSSVQVLAFASWLLKEAYEKQQKEDEKKQLIHSYCILTGAYAEKYYNQEQLVNIENRVIEPDVLAAYWIEIVRKDGKANSVNVENLRQALELFPPYSEEIRDLLRSLE